MTQVTVVTASTLPVSAQANVVRTRDGVELATDVYLPDAPGPHPAIVTRLPYDKTSPLMAIETIAAAYNAHGYAFVAQDVRGKFRSTGATYPFVSETADTYDTLEWVAAQEWSDGRIGMTGESYHGYTQWAGVASGHPALKAIAPRVTGIELGLISQMSRTDQHLIPLYMANYFAHYWVDRNENLYDTDWSIRPLFQAFEGPFASIGARSSVLDDARTGTSAPAPFTAEDVFRGSPIPVLHRVGWQDNLLDMSMRDYLRQLAVPEWRDYAYLDADSCDHYSYSLEDAPATPETDHGSNPDAFAKMLVRYLGRNIEFFDAFVAERIDPDTFARAAWHQGFAEARQASEWPPSEATGLAFNLTRLDQALRSADGGALSPRTSDEEEVQWVHDPEAPVPSTVVNPFVFAYEYPDEQQVEQRPDVATFTSSAFEGPVDLTGPVHVELAMSSDAPSLDAHVKLMDVHPDGRAHMILRGQARTHGTSPIRVDLGHTGYRLRPGHRFRLHIACSDFPLYAPNPANGEPDWSTTTYRTARVRLQSNGSKLHLTVSPEDSSES